MGMTYTPTNADTDRRRQGQYPKAKTGFVSKFTPHLVIFREISENASNPWNCFIYLRLYRKRTANVLFLVVPRCIRFTLDVKQYWYVTHIGYIYFGKFQRSPQALCEITWSLSYTFKKYMLWFTSKFCTKMSIKQLKTHNWSSLGHCYHSSSSKIVNLYCWRKFEHRFRMFKKSNTNCHLHVMGIVAVYGCASRIIKDK